MIPMKMKNIPSKMERLFSTILDPSLFIMNFFFLFFIFVKKYLKLTHFLFLKKNKIKITAKL